MPLWAVASCQEKSAIAKATPMSAAPTGPAAVLSCGPKAQRMIAPSSGKSQSPTISGYEPSIPITCIALSLHRRDVVDVDEGGAPEDDDHDREPDRRFRGGHGDHQKREDVTGIVEPGPAEGEQREVRRVPHQLDR